MYKTRLLLLFVGIWLNAFILQAQKREEVYQQIDQLLEKGDWQPARSKAMTMIADEDWSAIPLYQVARSYHLELKASALNDTASHRMLSEKSEEYLGKMIQALPQKKSVKKDLEDYWLPILQDSTEEIPEQLIISKAMKLARKTQDKNEMFIEEAALNEVMLAELQEVYLACQGKLLEFQAETTDLEVFYLKATTEDTDFLLAVRAEGERLKATLLAYEKMWDGFEAVPQKKQKKFVWKVINPNALNYYRFDKDKFNKKEFAVYDFSKWAGGLLTKIDEVQALASEAKVLYHKFEALDTWTKTDISAAEKMVADWKAKMKKYGRTAGTEHILKILIEKGKYIAKRDQFLKQDRSGYLHKALRDKRINKLALKLDTMNGFASSIYPKLESYAYQQDFYDLLLKSGQPIALRDQVIKFSQEEKSSLDFMKASSVHLPPEFQDNIEYNGVTIWLRPGKKDISKLYEEGVYVTEAIREGGGGVALKGRYKTEAGPMPFVAFLSIDSEVVWLKNFEPDGKGTAIMPENFSVDVDKRVLYYRKRPNGKLWLEGVDPNGTALFQYEIDQLPEKQITSRDNAIWLLWKAATDESGLVTYKVAQVDYAGNEIKAATLGLDGNICSVIRYPKGIHITGNYKRLINWEGVEHKSKATRGYGTNVFVATLSTPELTRERLITLDISLYLNAAMFNPEANQLRLMGYKGDFQIEEGTNTAKGISQWQEYINP